MNYLNGLPTAGGPIRWRSPSKTARFLCLLFTAFAIVPWRSEASTPSEISSVSVSKGFFNPGLGQKVAVSFVVRKPGALNLFVVDGQERVVRKLASGVPVDSGRVSYVWDGRGDTGRFVPDDAYSLRIQVTSRSGNQTYAPASGKSKPVKAATTFYDRQNGILAYKLTAPSRVFIHGRSVGASRTIVSGEPRAAGSVIDHWNGFDASGEVYIPDLPEFSISISAVALPENAIITVGAVRPGYSPVGGGTR